MSNRSKQTTHLYLVRHGETDFNRRGIVQGRGVDVPLNNLGRLQAVALAERASSFALDAVYASTLLRARQTAQAVVKRQPALPLSFLRDLEEMSWGDYEGREVTPALRTEFDTLREAWRGGNYSFSIGNGESALDVQKRSLRALEYICDRHAGQRVMVVAHGRFLRILLASILTQFGLQRMEALKHSNTGINYLEHAGGVFTMQYLDNTDHLNSINA